ncbi:MAG: serine--tRNA ligase [gamma proteobacterium endosymbiont of Trioza apicalis]
MIDYKKLFNKPYIFAFLLARRNFLLDINILIKKEKYRKILQIKTEKLQAQQNIFNKLINIFKINDKDISFLILKVNILNNDLNQSKKLLLILKNKIINYLLSIPNITTFDTPFGFNEKSNIEIYRWGKPINFDFKIKDHVELGELIKELNFSKAVKLTGSKFVVMCGQIACLHRALIQFMLDLHIIKHGYKEYYLPYLVNHISLYGTGQLPKFNKDLFFTNLIDENNKNNNYALIPTAEVPLINLMRDEIIEESILPIRMVSHTPCFRSEVGSYGRDTRGLSRLHQFDKVEIVQIVKPENSTKTLEEITQHAEKVLRLLNLPYRKILLCSGDTGFSSCKTYDLEVWLPSQNLYKEISSCSNVGDFQARRMHIRYRKKNNKRSILVHTLNASGLAVGRTLMALLENYQLCDGRIKIPVVLKSYMKGASFINCKI